MYTPQKKLKLDIILSGYEEDKDKIKSVIQSLQKQLDDTRRLDIGVMFGLGNKKEDNLLEIRNKVITTMLNTEYYVILECVDTFEVMPNYIQSLIQIIEKNESPETLTLHGIIKYES